MTTQERAAKIIDIVSGHGERLCWQRTDYLYDTCDCLQLVVAEIESAVKEAYIECGRNHYVLESAARIEALDEAYERARLEALEEAGHAELEAHRRGVIEGRKEMEDQIRIISGRSYNEGHENALEEAAKIVDMECLPKCDSQDHEDLCPYVYPAAAIRALKSVPKCCYIGPDEGHDRDCKSVKP